MTTPGQSDNEGVFHIPLSSKSVASPSDGFVSYPGHSLLAAGSYPSAEILSAYSTATTYWAINWNYQGGNARLFTYIEMI